MVDNSKITFEHHIKTGSGNVSVKLTFTGDSLAEINFDLRWMGTGYKGFKMKFSHEAFSENYGLLRLISIEKLHEPVTIEIENLDKLVWYPEFPDMLSDPDLPEDAREVLREITFEYIRLPQSETYISDDPGYRDMKALGAANWNEKFDLILLLQFCAAYHSDYGAKFKDEELENLLSNLDKMKFLLEPKSERS